MSAGWRVDLEGLVIGGFVRGLLMRDVESREDVEVDRLGVCAELHERFEAFCRRSLYDIHLVVLFFEAIYLPVLRSGPKECDLRLGDQ